MNQQKHWDQIGGRYDDEIFDVFRSDKNKKIQFYFRKHANSNHRAIDFGCGMGKAFRYLSPSFKQVLAIDVSTELLKQAKINPYKNIAYQRADLTRRSVRFPASDFVFCCNVIMLPEPMANRAMIKNIFRALKGGGTAVTILPSLESVLFASSRLIEWYRKEGVPPERIPNTEFDYYQGSRLNLVQGLISIDGVTTKHYTEPELRWLFADAGLTITALDKVEYEWSTEFIAPPTWMKAPHPWDWLIECKK